MRLKQPMGQVRAGSNNRRPGGRCARWLWLLLLQLAGPGAGGQPSSAPTSSLVCNPEREFTCTSERRCVAIECRCDFSEQCLDGQDELGCLPATCTFQRDLCNFYNEPWRAGLEPAIWRRIALVSGELDKHDLASPERGSTMLEALARLTSSTGARNATSHHYLMVPLGLAQRGQARARLRSRTIGQTNSMCQLRFRYAMWIGSPRAPASARQVGDASSAALRLQLELRAPSAPGPLISWSRVLNLHLGQLDWSVGVLDMGHLSQVELSLSAEIVRDKEQIEHLGVNQTDQVRAFVLFDWMKFQGCAWPQGRPSGSGWAPSAVQAEPSRTSSPIAKPDLISTPSASTPTNVSSSEPTWSAAQQSIKNPSTSRSPCSPDQFQCSNGLCLDQRKVCNFVDDCMSVWPYLHPLQPAPAGRPVGEPTRAPAESQQTGDACPWPLDGDEAPEVCANVPGKRNFESGLLAGSGPCKTSQLVDLDQACFWSLEASRWPRRLVTIRDSRAANENPYAPIEHLPRSDHTLRQAEGHYLSLEIPANGFTEPPMGAAQAPSQPEGAHAAGANMTNVYWTYLKSDWLRKRDPGECRLKFFYNLVSNHPMDWPTRRANANPAAPASSLHPFRLYLVAEHFKLDAAALTLSRSSDALAYTRPLPSGSSPRLRANEPIQLAGVDFWREANYELEGLEDGDIFFIRLAVIAELDPHFAKPFRATLNIDDLTTHLGCTRAFDGATREAISSLALAQEAPRLRDFFSSRPSEDWSLTDSNHEPQSDGQTDRQVLNQHSRAHNRDLKPHKLIICVFAVLTGIMGIILVIVFIVVPYVEQITMNYHDQLTMGLSQLSITVDYLSQSQLRPARGESGRSDSSPDSLTITFPANNLSSTVSSSILETSELAADWEHLSRAAWRLHSPAGFELYPDSELAQAHAMPDPDQLGPDQAEPDDLHRAAAAAATTYSSDSALAASDEEV